MDTAPVSESPQFIRLSLDIVLEVTDEGLLRTAALEAVKGDEDLSAEERNDAVAAIEADLAESVSYLIDPFRLVADVPGTELSEAGWQSEGAEYVPEDDEMAGDEED
jgi:hypothetical protein